MQRCPGPLAPLLSPCPPPTPGWPLGASGHITSTESKPVMPIVFQSPALLWPLAVCGGHSSDCSDTGCGQPSEARGCGHHSVYARLCSASGGAGNHTAGAFLEEAAFALGSED